MLIGNVNQTTIIGTVCRNPIPKLVEYNRLVTNFAVITEQRFKTQQGKVIKEREYHEIVVWGKLANSCAKNLVIGRLVYIRGRSHRRELKDKATGRIYHEQEIIGEEVQFLGPRPESKKITEPEDSSSEFEFEAGSIDEELAVLESEDL